jgi:hypothetical protein
MSSTPAGSPRAEPLSEPLGVDLVRRGLSAGLGHDPRSLPAALRGRDGLVRGLVDAEDLRQSGDLQDLQDPLLRADQIQRAVVGPHRLRPPTSTPRPAEPGNPTSKVEDELVAARADQVDAQLPQATARYSCRFRLDVDDLVAVLGVVTQPQIHMSLLCRVPSSDGVRCAALAAGYHNHRWKD